MVDLAVSYGGGPVSTATLAGMQGISQAYLEQLISALKKAELITAERGVQGGYALSRPPETISVGQVLTALEGNTSLVDCVGYETVSCDKACSCSARPLWLKLQGKIDSVLNENNLKDMANDYIIQKNRGNDGEASLS